jgi:anthranilate synthase component II
VVDVFLLDNRDSFTWNLAQAFRELGASVDVVDTDTITAASVLSQRPRLVCIGPGPRGPADLPHLVDVTRGLDGEVPILGICLGLQVLVRAHGGSIVRAKTAMHGKRDLVQHDGRGVFAGLPSPLSVMRYHSLVALDLPAGFTVTARDQHGQVMGLRGNLVEAVQFHPESIGTSGGMEMLANALKSAGVRSGAIVHRPGAVPPPSAKLNWEISREPS